MHDRFRTRPVTRRAQSICLLLFLLLAFAIAILDIMQSKDFSSLIYLLLNIPLGFLSFLVPRYVYRRLLRQIPETDRKNQSREINRKVRTRPLLYAAFTFLAIFFLSCLLSMVTPFELDFCIAGGLFLFRRVRKGLRHNDWSYLDGTWKNKIAVTELESFESPEHFEK